MTGWERYKGGTRVGFACGLRAVRHHRLLRDVVTEATRALSVQMSELPEAVRRLQTDAREARQQMRGLTESLAKYEAAELASAAEEIAGLRVVVRVVDRDAAGLEAARAGRRCARSFDVVLFSASRPALVVAARGLQRSQAELKLGPTTETASTDAGDSPTVVGPNFSSAFDAKAFVASLIARFGGKGGGRPELAQAGGLDEDPHAIAAAAAELAARAPVRASGAP